MVNGFSSEHYVGWLWCRSVLFGTLAGGYRKTVQLWRFGCVDYHRCDFDIVALFRTRRRVIVYIAVLLCTCIYIRKNGLCFICIIKYKYFCLRYKRKTCLIKLVSFIEDFFLEISPQYKISHTKIRIHDFQVTSVTSSSKYFCNSASVISSTSFWFT